MNEYMCALMEIKSIDSKGLFEGYASTFGNIDAGRDVVVAGAFKETLAEHEKNGTMPSMFYSHDTKESIGDWLDMHEDSKGLKATGQLWIDQGIPKAQQAYNLLKGKSVKGLSIGYGKRGSNGFEHDGKKQVRLLKNLDLFETSPTAFPMNSKCTITAIKSVNQSQSSLSLRKADGTLITKRELEQALRDAGLSDKEAKAFIADGYDALIPRDEGFDELAKKLDEATQTLFR